MLKPKKTLENIKSYETALYPEKWDMKLDSNENYIGPSTKVLNALRNLNVDDISRYPHYGLLYEKIAELNKIDVKNVVITNGADEALSAVLNTYLTSEDNIVTAAPSFSMPEIYCGIIGAEYIKVPYKDKWIYPYDDILNAVNDSTKAIILTTPNNPTGDIIPLEHIIALLERFPELLIIIDETYTNYAGISNVCLTKKYENAVVIKSMSKDYALAGLRLGYIVSNKNNIANIKKVLSPYNVNSAAVTAAIAAVSDTNYINTIRKEIIAAKAYLESEFKAMGFVTYESYANFLLVDFRDKKELIFQKLKDSKIIVKKFSDNMLENCLRITIPTLSAAKRLISHIKSKDTLVFDMDGVLVDVTNSYIEAIKYTYNYYTGKDISDEMIQEAKRKGGLNNDWDLTEFLISGSGFKFPYENIVKVFQKQYWNEGDGSINNETMLIDKSLLEELSKKYNLAVFTGRPKKEAYYTLEKFDIKKYFGCIVTMDDVPPERQKPHTTGLYLIKESLFTDRLIYFGDTVDDAKCASDFGAYGVGVLPPNDKSQELENTLIEKGDKVVIKNINDLKTVLENIIYETESDNTKN